MLVVFGDKNKDIKAPLEIVKPLTVYGWGPYPSPKLSF